FFSTNSTLGRQIPPTVSWRFVQILSISDLKETGARWLVPSRAVVSFRRSIEIGLGFATPRRLGKHSQRIGRLRAAFLLKLRDPVGHGINHVARRFTCGSCFYLNDRTGFLALFDYFDLFLLRHCYFRVSFESGKCIQRNSRHTVPKS